MNVIQGTKTVSGEAVVFNTPREVNIESLRVHFSPQQEGDGNPSPSNVRNIVPYEGFNVYHSGKNLAHIVRFSPGSTLSPITVQTAYSNKYGTTIDTLYPIYPDTKLVTTQSQYDESVVKHHYRNGYFTIDIDNLKFGKIYTVSFKVTNIINNPLNATLNDLRVASPYGNYGLPQKIENDRIVFKLNYRQNANAPNRQHIAIYNCGMSFTMSEFMVTDENETDFTWEPYVGFTGKNILQLSKDTFIGNAVGNSRITVTNNTVSWSGSPDSTMNGGFIVPCTPNTTYIYSCNYPDNTAGFVLRVWESEEYSTVYSDYTLLVSQSHRGIGNTATFTTSESTNCLLVGFYIYSTAAESGGTADCFQLIEPYTFPRPSKNLIDIFNNPVFGSSIYSINNDGSVTISGSDSRGWTSTQINRYPLSAGTYTFSWTGCPQLQFATSEDNYANVTINTQPFTFTLNEDGFIKWKHSAASADYPITVYDQIEAGETATEYEPYFDRFYGGYVDLVKGELVVEWVKIRAKYRNWSNYSQFKVFYCSIVPLSFDNDSIYISDKLVSFQGYDWKIAPDNSVISGGNNYRYIFIKHEGVSSNAEFKDWLEEVDPIIVAKLQTPVHYPLSTQQIIAYKNKNNFWSSGDSVDVEYEYINIFDALESRKNIMKNTPYVSTASGRVANFKTDMRAPLKDLRVDFEPTQEGSGTPTPTNVREIIPPGNLMVTRGGKNLFNIDANWTVASYRYYDAGTDFPCVFSFYPKDQSVDLTVDRVGLGVSYYAPENVSEINKGYNWVIQNGAIKSASTHNRVTAGLEQSIRGQYCKYMTVYPKTDNVFEKLKAAYDVQLELGSTATDYEPYQPQAYIDVPICGKNLYNPATDTPNTFIRADAARLGQIATTTANYNLSDYIPVVSNTTYCINYNATSNATSAGLVYFRSKNSDDFIDGISLDDQTLSGGVRQKYYVFTTPVDCNYIRFSTMPAGSNIQLELGSEPTSYEPYHPIYGGYVDLVNGEIVEEWICIDPLDVIVDFNSDAQADVIVYKIAIPKNNIPTLVNNTCVSNRFSRSLETGVPGRMAQSTENIWFAIPRDELSGKTVEAAIEWFQNNPTIFVCKLSQPVHYPIPSRPLLTLSGTNNIWADNPTTTVEATYWKHDDNSIRRLAGTAYESTDDYAFATSDGFIIGEEADYIEY